MPAIMLACAPILGRVLGAVTDMLASAANVRPFMEPSVPQHLGVERFRSQAFLADVALVGFLMFSEAAPTFAAVRRESATSRHAPSTTGTSDRASLATLYGRIASASLLCEGKHTFLNIAYRANQHSAARRTRKALNSSFIFGIAGALGHALDFPTRFAHDDHERLL